jgi:CBS domain-containing protein
MRRDVFRSRGRPGPGGWIEAPSGYDQGYRTQSLWTEEIPGDREAGEFSDHPRAYHGYLRGIERSSVRVARGESLRVDDLMTVNPEAITPDSTLAEAAEWMEALGVGLLPVVQDRKNRRLVGTLSERDIVVHGVGRGRDPGTAASECMSRNLASVNRNDDIGRARQVMRQWHLDRIPVTDREGRLVGIIEDADLPMAGPRQPQLRYGPRSQPLPADSAHFRGGFVFGPTDRGGDVGFRSLGVRGLDEW